MAVCWLLIKNILVQGTAEAPYWVENAEHLNNVRLFPDAHFIQTADIDTGNDVFKPIGDFDTPFTGHFDGEGHRITVNELGATEGNIKLAGLWGFTSGAEIKNLNVDVYASLKLDGRGALKIIELIICVLRELLETFLSYLCL